MRLLIVQMRMGILRYEKYLLGLLHIHVRTCQKYTQNCVCRLILAKDAPNPTRKGLQNEIKAVSTV